VLTQELWSVQSECDVRVRGMESRLRDQGQQLEVYEKLERELDEVVMQAAESEPLALRIIVITHHLHEGVAKKLVKTLLLW